MSNMVQENHTASVVIELAHERARQRDTENWSEDHDDSHSVNDWAALVVKYLGRAMEAADAGDSDAYRRRLVQSGAIIVAGIESLDRVIEVARQLNIE